jgi:hypothetical protein
MVLVAVVAHMAAGPVQAAPVAPAQAPALLESYGVQEELIRVTQHKEHS